MISQIIPVAALLLGSAFLLFAGGINGLILPVRGAAEGFTPFALGLLGTGWALGFVTGCLLTSRLVAVVGHIRSFAAMAALAGITVLLSLLFITPFAWIPLRAISGFAFAGAAMIVESWLNERTDQNSRGRVFGVYTMINLGASTAGQMALIVGDTNGYLFFVIAAIFYACALLPTAITPTTTPKPLAIVKLDLRKLYDNSPVAVVAVLLIGVTNGTFGTLGPVYASEIGLTVAIIALFSSFSILAGAIVQIPVGVLSDKLDRRLALVIVVLVALMGDLIFIFYQPQSVVEILVTATIFGAAIFSLYPIAVAHAMDHAHQNAMLATSGGLLLLLGVGSIIGPLFGGVMMGIMGPEGLFMVTMAAHIGMLTYSVWRMLQRAAVPSDEKSSFIISPPARSVTPETLALAPKPDHEHGTRN